MKQETVKIQNGRRNLCPKCGEHSLVKVRAGSYIIKLRCPACGFETEYHNDHYKRDKT
jgi:predicted RNA-binding Zn-ribbon protein involved in translation (DUF1610 family)